MATDDQKHAVINQIIEDDTGEEDMAGTATDPDKVESEDTLDNVHKMGLYSGSDEEHPTELNVEAELVKDDNQR